VRRTATVLLVAPVATLAPEAPTTVAAPLPPGSDDMLF